MKKIFLILLIGLMESNYSIIYSQQDAQMTQYMYQTNLVNPAYSGSRGVTNIFAVYRSQWVGFEGAPKTFVLSMHTPFLKKNMGLGISIINDQIGIINETNFHIDYSYTAKLNRKLKLAFGLKAMVNSLSVDYSKLSIYHPNDQTFATKISNRIRPNFGTGVFLYSNDAYIGLSVSNLLDHSFTTEPLYSAMNKRNNFYLIAGLVRPLSQSVKFKPAILLKAVNGAPLQGDFSANFLFNNKVTCGLSYRTSSAFALSLGLQLSTPFFIGYSYDIETSSLSRYSSGSHEIFARYELKKKKNNLIVPRFF